MATGSAQASRRPWRRPIAVIITILAVSLACVALSALHFITGWPSSPPPSITIVGYNCGHVYQGELPNIRSRVYDPDQGELCLWRAYTSCHTSTLLFDLIAVDGSSTDAITVQPSAGHCVVTDTDRGYGQRFNGVTTTGGVYQCAGIAQDPTGGLRIKDCGNGDIVLLPRPPQQMGHVCGILRGDTHAVGAVSPPFVQTTHVSDVEACFWRASGSCTQPATLVYEQNSPPYADGTPSYVYTEHTLVVQPSHGVCALTDAALPPILKSATVALVTYSCGSLSRDTDGSLVAQGCGTEGQVMVPSASLPA